MDCALGARNPSPRCIKHRILHCSESFGNCAVFAHKSTLMGLSTLPRCFPDYAQTHAIVSKRIRPKPSPSEFLANIPAMLQKASNREKQTVKMDINMLSIAEMAVERTGSPNWLAKSRSPVEDNMTEVSSPPKGRKFRGQVYINWDDCKGCGFCIEFCPPKVLAIFRATSTTTAIIRPYLANEDACTGCDLCGLYCPDFAIYGVRVPKET